MPPKRLLILSASVGAGHMRAGDALSRIYEERFDGRTYHVDFLRYALPRFGRMVEGSYYFTTKYIPVLYKYLYYLEDRPSSLFKTAEISLGLKKCYELVRKYRPQAILSTHPFPALVVSELYSRIPIPNGAVLTDYVSHCVWANPNTQRFFVAHACMVEQLVQEGAPRDRIRVTGIPSQPCSAVPGERHEVRQKLGLDPGLSTILVMSGGNAIGPMTDVLKTLDHLRTDFQVIVITGRNQGAFRELQALMAALGLHGRVLGFVDNVPEYMAASDLLISKAGGLTVSEALAAGLPFVIIRPTPGQEDGNTQFLERSGCGIYLKNPSLLRECLTGLFREPSRLELMRRNALQLAKPNAAEAILTEMDRLILAKPGWHRDRT